MIINKQRLITIGLYCILIVASCIRQDYLIDLTQPDNEEQLFEISVLKIDGINARVQVTHSGTNKDNYLVFCTDDLFSPVSDIYNRMLKDSGCVFYRNQRKTIVNFKLTKLSTMYRIVVCPVSDDKEINYDCAKELVFTSNEDIGFVAQTTPSLQIDFCDDSHSQVKITVRGSAMRERFFITVLTEDEINSYDNVEFLLGCEAYDFMRKYNNDMSLATSNLYNSDRFVDVKLKRGRQYVYAIGITDDGTASGMYAVTESVSVDIPEYAREFEGKYVLRGDDSKVFDVYCVSPDSLVIKGFAVDNSLEIGMSYYKQGMYEGIHFFMLECQFQQHEVIGMRYGLSFNDLVVGVFEVKEIQTSENGGKNYKFGNEQYFLVSHYNSSIRLSEGTSLGFAIVAYDAIGRQYYLLDVYEFPFVLDKITDENN